MASITIDKNESHGYTAVDNTVLEQHISLQAKGLFMMLWKKPKGWQYYMDQIISESTNGKTSTRNALDELKEHGFVRIERRHDQKGRFSNYVWHLDEFGRLRNQSAPKVQKRDLGQKTDNKAFPPKDRKRDLGQNVDIKAISPKSRFPALDNQPLINTYTTNNVVCSSPGAHTEIPNQDHSSKVTTANETQTEPDELAKQSSSSNVEHKELKQPNAGLLADPNGLNQIFTAWKDQFSWPNQYCQNAFSSWQREFGTDVVLHMIDYAAMNGASYPLQFLNKVVAQYRKDQVHDISTAIASEQLFKRRKSQYQHHQGQPNPGKANFKHSNRQKTARVVEKLPEWAQSGYQLKADPPDAATLAENKRLMAELKANRKKHKTYN
ncbi:hypothetical protein [uncultured Limosilactobacillus sp.]|uniref:hypothetical protein n=1 Tax=uncultured Limosilactobacillus sp. TaxID=2837629 RepID=UPI0025D72169|nr:hypothetical protein [uncultured Limosilactobacillus sp.]